MLRHRLAMLGVFVAVLVATVEMFGIVPKGFIPDQDNDSMNVNLRAAQGTSYYDMTRWLRAGRRHRHQEPVRRRRSTCTVGSNGGSAEQRPVQHAVDAAGAAAAVGAADRAADHGRSCCASRASAASSRLPAGDPDRRAPGQPELQPHGAEPELPTSSTTGRPGSSRPLPRRCPRSRTSPTTWR